MKKKIKEKTMCSLHFKRHIEVFLEDNNIDVKDVIGISSQGDSTTLWYWDK